MTLKDRIKKLCKENNISMNALEKELGFAVGYISKLGKSTPNSKYMQLIADYFNVSVDYLMTGKEPTDNKYSPEMAKLVGKIRNDAELSKALLKYFELSEEKKKYVITTIYMLAEEKRRE